MYNCGGRILNAYNYWYFKIVMLQTYDKNKYRSHEDHES